MSSSQAGIDRSVHSQQIPPGMLNMNSLMTELDFHRKKAQRLAVINELHGRLARANDLSGMIEALSVWLLPRVSHELIAYSNPLRGRQYSFCSCHGPKRRQVVSIAQKMLDQDSCGEADHCRVSRYHVQKWHLNGPGAKQETIILLRDKAVAREEQEWVDDALSVLPEPLQRALDYEDLFEMANHDSLTGLANRRVFEDRIGALIDSARRHDQAITLASMDLDHFKQVNDLLGHAEGDRVLQLVAKKMKKAIRSSDLLVRMGGDEFILVLPATDLASAQLLAERLCSEIDQLQIQAPGAPRLGVSIGLVSLAENMRKEEWLVRADEVLYQAKSTGRSRVCIS